MSYRRLFWLFTSLIMMASVLIAGCTVGGAGDQVRTELITVQVIVTATPDPNVTPNVMIITATLDRTQVAVPDDIAPESDGTVSSQQLNVTRLPDDDSSDDSGIPSECLIHIVDEGDTMFGLAEVYGVNPFVMLEVNGFTEETAFLNIGDELIIPIEGCPLEDIIPPTLELPDDESETTPEVTAEVTAEVTSEVTEAPENLTPSPTPTVTLAPTATNSEVEIVEVIRAGDVTVEGVRIRNNGRLVDVAGWTISDADGNEFTFDALLIFSNSEHTVYTRTSDNTPIASYWGLEEPVWQAGDVVTLTDDDGDVQAVYRIPAEDEAP